MLAATLSAIVLVLLSASTVQAQYPELIVNAFCEADGRGERLVAGPGSALTEAFGGRFQPAWDRLLLISGYEVEPRRIGPEEAEIEVRYTVVAEVTGEGVDRRERLESVRLALLRGPDGWRLVGPPPPPHLFASGFEAEPLAALLRPLNEEYISNSKFVWQMFQNASWSVPYRPTSAFLSEELLRPVAEPRVGDVVAYLDRGVPYHVGLYVGEDRVASATITGGVARTALNAFAGEIRYLRLTEAARPTPTVPPEEAAPEDAPAPE